LSSIMPSLRDCVSGAFISLQSLHPFGIDALVSRALRGIRVKMAHTKRS
jgi:hypothetical protein